jgi:hypothetical protein
MTSVSIMRRGVGRSETLENVSSGLFGWPVNGFIGRPEKFARRFAQRMMRSDAARAVTNANRYTR